MIDFEGWTSPEGLSWSDLANKQPGTGGLAKGFMIVSSLKSSKLFIFPFKLPSKCTHPFPRSWCGKHSERLLFMLVLCRHDGQRLSLHSTTPVPRIISFNASASSVLAKCHVRPQAEPCLLE